MSVALMGFLLVLSLLCAAASGRMLVRGLYAGDRVNTGLAATAFGVWLALSVFFAWRLL